MNNIFFKLIKIFEARALRKMKFTDGTLPGTSHVWYIYISLDRRSFDLNYLLEQKPNTRLFVVVWSPFNDPIETN